MVLVEFAIKGPPVSQQTRIRRQLHAFVGEVRRHAAIAFGQREPYAGTVRVEMTYVYDVVSIDVDNIAKPILDGMKGTVLADDAQVTDILVMKRPLTWSPGHEAAADLVALR
jgi:Holliday junction resolvase RusA-like endonuclease